MTGKRAWIRVLALLCIASCGGFGASKDSGGTEAPRGGQVTGSGGIGGGDFGSPRSNHGGTSSGMFGDAGEAAPMLPPEMEVDIDFEQPQASERFVYAANPD